MPGDDEVVDELEGVDAVHDPGVNPAIDASVRSTSSSAVWREFTIQSRSAYVAERAPAVRTSAPRVPTAISHSGVTSCSLRHEAGARS